MALTQRDKEGYLLIDHSQTQGVSDEVMMANGMPIGSGHGKFEAPTFTCSHCEAVCIVRMPRAEAIPYCPKCSHHICNKCEKRRVAAGGECHTFKDIADIYLSGHEAKAMALILPLTMRD